MKINQEDQELKGVFIPKSTIWTLIVTIGISLITLFTRLEVGFKLLEKEIEITNIRLTNTEKSNNINIEHLQGIKEQLYNIEKVITMKQDKKFVE